MKNNYESAIIKRGEKKPKKYKISAEQIEEIKELRKTIKDKKTDKRLHAVQLRGEGLRDKEIAERLENKLENFVGEGSSPISCRKYLRV